MEILLTSPSSLKSTTVIKKFLFQEDTKMYASYRLDTIQECFINLPLKAWLNLTVNSTFLL